MLIKILFHLLVFIVGKLIYEGGGGGAVGAYKQMYFVCLQVDGLITGGGGLIGWRVSIITV